MKILIDTNILIDYATERVPYTETAKKVMDMCINEEIEGCIAVHSLLNMFFILRKDIPDTTERRNQLLDLTEFLDVIEVDKTMIIHSLKNNNFKDFEDCVQAECAIKANADYIITRNVKDFEKSPVKAILPEELLKEMK